MAGKKRQLLGQQGKRSELSGLEHTRALRTWLENTDVRTAAALGPALPIHKVNHVKDSFASKIACCLFSHWFLIKFEIRLFQIFGALVIFGKCST